ncbi:L-ribulose-5-phosphate 4-epimerase [Pseudothermotoga thermarum]|uniref:L-ribulose-5-phosphate 4-epimerase n=1 Tax=Pseudothermotoga thermarum DSM 5069 TaxID=688269 RepID=F7YTI2_9THEM|nr:L-ribulose-5-phosphate 4-epimerase [Pseudothermotoga thermarum]AEH51196.1 L-ribulose 5-phosphate 4-epimerase [Pseudothermotoga thermarum DSM 5069]
MYEKQKQELYEAHMMLERYNLVAYTSGNISVRIQNHVIIKPSGVPYSSLKPEDFVVVDLDGNIVEGNKKPSVDTATHLYLYKNLDWVYSVIHTHSTFATVWAILEREIPVLCTAHADVFGEKIPITEYAPVGSEAIGKAAMKVMGKSGTVLLRKHGVLIAGTSLEDALKKAIFLEEVAKASYYAILAGNPIAMDPQEVDKLYNQYHTKYGQK